jgi:hypothetical protein
MADITIVNGVYKPTNITGGHHPVLVYQRVPDPDLAVALPAPAAILDVIHHEPSRSHRFRPEDSRIASTQESTEKMLGK